MKIRSRWKQRFGTKPLRTYAVRSTLLREPIDIPFKRLGWNANTPVPTVYVEPPTITTTKHEPLLYGDSERRRDRR